MRQTHRSPRATILFPPWKIPKRVTRSFFAEGTYPIPYVEGEKNTIELKKFRNRICPDCFLRERPRKGDHRLSISGAHLFELVRGSDLIDKGSNIGYEYVGSAPDLGPFEYSAAESSSTEETTRVVKQTPNSSFSKPARRFDALGKAIRKTVKKAVFSY